MVGQHSAQVGFLATGDELMHGDILNTNSQKMAQWLLDSGISPGQQVLVSDDEESIVRSLDFLLAHHVAVVITGGLGPTSDDVTRQAVATWLGVELEFHEHCWQRIQNRLQKRGIAVPENNRQQCFFPVGATILKNENGTADGFVVEQAGQIIVVLPGPPRECLPLFKNDILRLFHQRQLTRPSFSWKWLLMGLGESEIASRVDMLSRAYDVKVGYRASYPYCELKIFAESDEGVAPLLESIGREFSTAIVSDSAETASQKLKIQQSTHPRSILIEDAVTRGRLQSLLAEPGQHAVTDFEPQGGQHYDVHICVSGMHEFWVGSEASMDEVVLEIKKPQVVEHRTAVRLYGKRTLDWVCEYVCWQCLKHIN